MVLGMPRVQKVLVVGGGIGGLCLAVALRDTGIDVDIVEIKQDWTVYGVGIIQQSNVVRAMAQLGLVDEYLAASFPFEKVAICAPDGHLLATLPGRRLAGPNYPANLGIARPALHNVLTRAAIGRGARVKLGCTVNAIEENADAVAVTLSTGERKSYDLVVGADGAHSKVRSLVFPEAPAPRFTGQGVWRYNFVRSPEVDHLLSFVGPGGAGLVPLADDLMYMYIVCTEAGNLRLPKDQLHVLMQERASVYGGIVGRIRSQITDPAKVVYRPVEVVMLPEPWFRGRVILIGDAAHTTSPHLGQGAGMAVEDAIVLSQELSSSGALEDSLARFMRRRFERCKFIVEKSELVGTWQMNRSPEADIPALVNEMLQRTAEPI
jgi:2-polyprenyl-6-methoxyphenol hydroxylase-like FAD-dependent oxidoreductase